MAIDDLYERDFYLWTQAQAEALRRRSANALDYDVLAEEVEDMGRSAKNAAMSHATRAIEHLFKLAWTQREEPKGGWRREVLVQRKDCKRELTPTIRKLVSDSLEELHVDAAEIASASFAAYEPDAPRDATLRWTLAQILGEEDDPLA